MNQIGARILCDQDGEIVLHLSEMQGDVPTRKDLGSVEVIDLDYGQIDFTKYRIIKIDTVTKQPILEEIQREQTAEERIQELENQILLMADAEAGGIL